jgi:chromate transporter
MTHLAADLAQAWQLNWSDWWELFSHFMGLSLLAIGGAITTAPDIHRYMVDEHQWLTDAQFSASIAIAQTAPGPNAIFIALMGWNAGLVAFGYTGALAAMSATLIGIMLPSTITTLTVTRWMHTNRERLGVQAFKAGLVPVTLALLVATAYLLTTANAKTADWPFWLMTGVSTFMVWRTKVHMLWLLGVGALVGGFLA